MSPMTTVRALGGEAARGGEADAARAARDDGDLALQSLGEVDGGDGHGAGSNQLWEKKTFLVSVKASGASGPSSRPSPPA